MPINWMKKDEVYLYGKNNKLYALAYSVFNTHFKAPKSCFCALKPYFSYV